MYKKFSLLICLILIFLSTTTDAYSGSGCCSNHGGVCGDKCCDGTPLSVKCGGNSSSTSIPNAPDYKIQHPSPSDYSNPPDNRPENTSAYNRKDWPHWVDADNDCQDTRAEILIRNNVGVIKFKRNKPCNVSWGRWICPYTGQEYLKASDMDIDHVVSLSDAHKSGGAGWTRSQKRTFANDPENLLSVGKTINIEKSDKGPDEWRPPNKAFWSEYAKKYRHIKMKYGLRITSSEDRALKEMME